MDEEIINALTKIEGLHVTSRTSAFQFKASSGDIREIGRRLNVNTVLEGSVRKAGDRLRITAQLINVADDYHLWSERFDRETKDVFAIQDEIAQHIVKALRPTLSPKDSRVVQNQGTTNVQAYDYYLRGRTFFHRRGRKNAAFALQMFQRAIEIDPEYALAYAGLADCSSFTFMYSDASKTIQDKAVTASLKAVELNPELAEAHASRGLALSLDEPSDEGQREYETAIRLDPNLFEAYYFYGRSCFGQGELDKAARLFQQAAEVRPENFDAPLLLAAVYRGLGREDLVRACRRQALDVIEAHLELNPDDVRAVYSGAIALVDLGERERGLEWAARALAMDPDDSTNLYNVACAYSLAGEADKAIDTLERTIGHGWVQKDWLENDTDFESLRTHSRFQALLTRM